MAEAHPATRSPRPLLPWRAAELGAVAAGEVRAGDEAVGDGHVEDRLRAVHQHLARALQAQLAVEMGWGLSQYLGEAPLQMAQRQAGDAAELRQRQGILEVLLHRREGRQQAYVVDPGTRLQGHALRVVGAAH